MGFLKKMFRRGGSKKVKEQSHKNIGELPSSPANKMKAAKKISRTEKKMAKQAQKAAKKAAKNGGSLYGQGSPGSPTNAHTRKAILTSSGRYEYTSQPDVLPNVGASAPSPGSISAKSVSMNPVMDDVVRRPSFNTSSLKGSTAKSGHPIMSINTDLANGHPPSTRSRGSGPVDLDDEIYGSTTDEEQGSDDFAASPLSSINGQPQYQPQYHSQYQHHHQQLNHHQLQQFEMQQRANGYHGNGAGAQTFSSSQYASLYGSQQRHHQVTRLANGQLVAYDSPDKRGNGGGRASPAASPTYSSDFCLSTDNEDENYNQMRRDDRGLLPGAPPGVNLPPALDSPDNDSMMYTDDEQGTLFANLKGQFSEDEGPMSPPTSPEADLLPPPPSGAKPPPPAATAPVRPQGPRDPDGDFSHMDPLSKEEEAEVVNRNRWAQGHSPDKSKMSGSNYTAATGSSRSGIDGSSNGSVENRNPNPHGTSTRYTFADGEEAAVYKRGAGAKIAAEDRPASPSPGYKVNGVSGSDYRNRGAVMYPDSTDSEFESVPVPNGNLLPAMQQQQHDQRAQSQDAERYMNQQQNVASANTTEMVPVRKQGSKQGSQYAVDAFGDSFANFANFESDFDPFTSANGSKAEQKQDSQAAANGASKNDGFGSSGPTFVIEGGPTVRHSSADSSPLDDLMALQKEREANRQMNSSRRSGNDPSKSSSSINSAPVITSANLRQAHKLGNIAGDGSVASGRRKSSRHSEAGGRSNVSVGSSSAAMAAKDKLRQRRREKERARAAAAQGGSDDDGSDADRNESWLFDGVTGTLGPRGIAADLESLGGRSNRSKNSTGNKSHRSHRSHRSSRSRRRKNRSDGASVGSRDSRYSHKSYRSTRSQLSHMSEQSRSVANDLLRLEMQLAMVGAQKSGGDGDRSVSSRRSKTSRGDSSRRSKSASKRSKVTVVAPPGKLGIILANKTDSKGTVVSGVRTSSVLAEKVSPGDRIIAIDGEDVSRMTVSEITTIMARKSEFERILTVLTTKSQADDQPSASGAGGEVISANNGASNNYR